MINASPSALGLLTGTLPTWHPAPKETRSKRFFAIVQKKKPKNIVFLFLRDGISKAAEYAKKKGFTLREFFLNKKLTQ